MKAIDAIGYCLGAVFITLGTLVSLLNWLYVIQSARTGRFISGVPLFGAAFLATGALLIPGLRWYAWLAIPLDWGTLALVLDMPQIIREEWQTCSWNLLEEYVGRRGDTVVRLRLFRRGHLVVYWGVERLRSYGGRTGHWTREAESLVLRLGDDHAIFKPTPRGGNQGWLQATGFQTSQFDANVSLDAMEFVLKD